MVRLEPVRSAEPPTSSGSSGASASIAFCEALRVAMLSAFAVRLLEHRRGVLRPACRKLARHAAPEFRGKIGILLRVGGKLCFPGRLEFAALPARIPGVVDLLRHFEGRIVPADRRARRGHFLFPQRRAMRLAGVRLGGRALRDHRLAADEAGTVGHGPGLHNRAVDRFDVVAVDGRDDVPSVGLEAPGRVVAEPCVDVRLVGVDRDPVVVVEHDQLAQAERSGKRAGLVRDALHQAAVPGKHVGVVIDDVEARPVELGRKHPFRDRHADGVGQSLSERSGGGLHPGRAAVFRMAGRHGVQLAEAPQLVHRQLVAGEVQQRVEQHRAVAVGEHEAVAVGPFRIGGIVAQMAGPQRQRDLGHAHGHARMAGVRRLHRVHGQRAHGVGRIGGLAHSNAFRESGDQVGRTTAGLEQAQLSRNAADFPNDAGAGMRLQVISGRRGRIGTAAALTLYNFGETGRRERLFFSEQGDARGKTGFHRTRRDGIPHGRPPRRQGRPRGHRLQPHAAPRPRPGWPNSAAGRRPPRKGRRRGGHRVFLRRRRSGPARGHARGRTAPSSRWPKGSIFVDHTTASAKIARELAAEAKKRGIDFLDAPVSGGQAGAENGALTVMVGGDARAFERAKPVIAHFARAVTLLGPSGAASSPRW